jgi:hypothetical protein
MSTQSAREMLTLVDRKPFTARSRRRLRQEGTGCVRHSQRDYALELPVACTRPRTKDHRDATPFYALLDTGFPSRAAISLWHYEHYCNCPIGFDDLPPANLTLFDGSKVRGGSWGGRLWLFPAGKRPQIQEPVRLAVGNGIAVIPPRANDAAVGMSALYALCAHVTIDYQREVFSVLIPTDMIRSE